DDGETGDFKCLTVVKLKPRPFRKPGLSFESNESSLRARHVFLPKTERLASCIPEVTADSGWGAVQLRNSPCPHSSRAASLPWARHQPAGRRRPPPHPALGRAPRRPPRAFFPRDFSGAPPPPPIRSKAPSARTAVARRSGTRSRTRRERSATTTTETSPTITITDIETMCSR